MPYLPDVHVDQFLTSISVRYTNEGFVGDDVFPTVAVSNRSNTYAIYDTSSFKVYDDLRRPNAVAPEIKYSITKGFYNAEEYSLGEFVPDVLKREADNPLDPEIDATLHLTETFRNQRENRQLGVAGDTTQVTNNIALSGTSRWDDYTNSTPLTGIRTARTTVRSAVHRPANTVLMHYDVGLVLADHPSVKELRQYTDPNSLTEEGLPPTIRGLRVLISVADKDTAAVGAAATYAPMFSKSALVFHRNPAPGLRSFAFGLTLQAPDQTTGARGMQIRKYRDEPRKGTVIEVAETYVVKLIAPTAGYLFTTVIS